ncbi:ABC transporter ATP-binding protein [Candidatus Bathyarchaeota archaeon]|nr:ABC transporter ATP-binding protein [Candidatus Bathyarchaeota archaeon]MBS7629560.1 ABC transporter ATP-binding protein [Candidatus Bathyarchaeota archaeon]
MLEVKNVSCAYGMVRVLWDVSFKAEEGEVTVIIGPNGAGKSTLVNLIVGVNKPAGGSVYFRGERIDGLPTYDIVRRGVSLIPEGRKIFPKMSVHENLLLGAYTLKDKEQVRRALEYVYEIFPVLREKSRVYAETMSGGEQQMLVIARGLMSKPRLLMLDEPTLGLAPILVEKMFDAIEQIKDMGMTILLVEQNIQESLEIGDRCYILEEGRIVRSGRCRELLSDDYVKEVYLGF